MVAVMARRGMQQVAIDESLASALNHELELLLVPRYFMMRTGSVTGIPLRFCSLRLRF